MMDLGLVARSLRDEAATAREPPAWLVESWRAPATFAVELAAWHDVMGPRPLKSSTDGYDLFHDFVLRHVALESPALVFCDGLSRRRALSFAELAARASGRASAWRRAGVVAGAVVAIARPRGVELTVSLLAAWQLGCVAAPLPPSGRLLARARLAALAPAFVDGDVLASMLPDGAVRLRDDDEGAADDGFVRAHVYAPGELAALVLEPTAPTSPRPLTADGLWLGALRDGAIALGLRSGDALAAPDWPLVGSEPALTVAALASGAAVVHASVDDLERAPELLAQQPLAILGVTPTLRELIVRRQIVLGESCKAWFRDPLHSTRLEPWQRFVAVAGLEGAAAMNVRFEAALGGVALFSPRRTGRAHCEALPAAGAAWSTVDFADATTTVAAGPGRLALATAEGNAATAAVIVPNGRAWICAGAVPAHPAGRNFPVAEARAAAAAVAGCRAAVVLHDPSGSGDAPRVLLLAFGVVDAAALDAALEDALGREDLPDAVLCFPLVPRRDAEGQPDARWCHQQLRAGLLAKKSRDELHLLLSRLRARVVKQAEDSP